MASPANLCGDLLIVPIRVPPTKMGFEHQTHGSFGIKDHGYALGRGLSTKNLHHCLVEKLDARGGSRLRIQVGGHGVGHGQLGYCSSRGMPPNATNSYHKARQ